MGQSPHLIHTHRRTHALWRKMSLSLQVGLFKSQVCPARSPQSCFRYVFCMADSKIQGSLREAGRGEFSAWGG